MKVSFTPTLSVLNQMQRTSKAISKSLERLSSGKRVNRAADDSVTLSRDSSMEAQVRGLRQGIQNANQAIGMLSTAESAISTQLEIVTKMRELALRASNGTLTSSDRTNINAEINQLFQEFQRITNTTEFNGQYLLNGSMGKVGLQIGDKRESGMDQIFMDISNLDASRVFQQTVGSGTFATRVTMVPDNYSLGGVATGDFNGDGTIDIVTSNFDASSASILLGKGDGTFEVRSTVAVTGEGGDVSVGDLNGDGILDFAVVGESDALVNIYIGNGDGTFIRGATMAGHTNIEFGDFNGDGKLDIFTGDGTNPVAIAVYLGSGDGSFGAAMSSGASASGVLNDFDVVDLNGDGYSDIALTDGDISLGAVYTNNRNNSTTNTWSTGLLFGDMDFGDFNNDGKVDMIYAGYAYTGNGLGGFTQGSYLGTTDYFRIGDLNGDGNLDLFSSTGRMMYGKGDGTFTFQKTVSLGTGVNLYELADLNNDGVLDLIGVDTIISTNAISTSLQTTQSDFRASRIDASTQAKAQSLLKILDNALTSLRSEQSRLGGLHERLDQAVSTNLLRADSIDEARENANSADLALETANLVRFQILQQAQVAVLAQANFSAQLVTQLLKF